MSTDPAIADLVHRYCDAVVHRDKEQWGSTWAADSRWELGKGFVIEGREAIIEFWVGAMARYTHVLQLANNGAATLDGDHGSGRWYITERTQPVDGAASTLVAYYDDTYVREEGEWKFASRQLVRLYAGPADLSGAFISP